MSKNKADETTGEHVQQADRTEPPPPQPAFIPPTIGRIVHILPENNDGKVLAAIVSDVPSEDAIHVCAFDPVFGPRNYHMTGYSANYPPAPGTWAWPPRV